MRPSACIERSAAMRRSLSVSVCHSRIALIIATCRQNGSRNPTLTPTPTRQTNPARSPSQVETANKAAGLVRQTSAEDKRVKRGATNDAAGNQMNDGTYTYGFDADNKIKQMDGWKHRLCL